MRRVTKLLVVLTLAVGLAAPSASAQPTTFTTTLSGAEEVPPRDTPARGVAIFQLSADGSELSYRIIVSNIENVFAAHIHCGDSDDMAPVGVTLFEGVAGSGPVTGVLTVGSVTDVDPTTTCPWTDLEDVVEAVEAGGAYVNVHTNDGVAPVNTGPGDFPGGEIRGQL